MKLYTADSSEVLSATTRRAVGVVVIAYNAENTLHACLDSLVGQTLCGKNADLGHKEFGIVVVNDGSIDSTPHILAEYHERFPDIIDVVTNDVNLGRGGARNAGVNYATHRFGHIGFVDADDWVAPAMYETMLATARCEHADIVICDYAAAGNERDVLFTFTAGDTALYGGSFEQNPRSLLYYGASLCNKLFAHHLFGRDPFPTHIDFEDLAVCYTLGNRAARIVKIDQLFYFYRQHDNGSIMGARDERYFEIFDALEIMLGEFGAKNASAAVEPWLALVCVQHLLIGRMHDVLLVAPSAMKRKFLNKAFRFLDDEFPGWKTLVRKSADVTSRNRFLITHKWAIRGFTAMRAWKN